MGLLALPDGGAFSMKAFGPSLKSSVPTILPKALPLSFQSSSSVFELASTTTERLAGDGEGALAVMRAASFSASAITSASGATLLTMPSS